VALSEGQNPEEADGESFYRELVEISRSDRLASR
jgi:hypothetical protein